MMQEKYKRYLGEHDFIAMDALIIPPQPKPSLGKNDSDREKCIDRRIHKTH